MIFRERTVSLLILVLLFSICCSTPKVDNRPIIDINGAIIIDKVSQDKVSYIKEDGRQVKAYAKGVEFKEGKEALKAYLDSTFYNNTDYHNYNEFNTLETFFILFDKDLNIKEVRILNRPSIDGSMYYDSIFVSGLKQTHGRWCKTTKNKKWYYYFHRQKIF